MTEIIKSYKNGIKRGYHGRKIKTDKLYIMNEIFKKTKYNHNGKTTALMIKSKFIYEFVFRMYCF